MIWAAVAPDVSPSCQQVTIALTDSLQDVFDKIALAAPDVTAGYNVELTGVSTR